MIGSLLRIRYELTALLHEEPVFAAYAARDRVDARDVGIRLFQPAFSNEGEMVTRLKHVVQKMARVRHPGLEALIDVDEDNGRPFLVTELSRGVTLSERIRKLAPFSVPVAVATAISICEALDSLHQAGLAHGDLNPLNIVAQVDGSVRLQLAGVWEIYSASPHAGALLLPQMAPYLAPEISAGGLPTPSSDIYSVGILLFHLIAGRLPFHADTPVAMALKHATAAVPSVRMFNPATPLVLDEIVKKSMAKEPSERYRNAGELLRDLRILQDALRFGRTLTWPLKPQAVNPDAPPITPRMSAVRPDPEEAPPKAKREREAYRGDVPVWMIASLAFFGAVALCLFAYWIFGFGTKAKIVRVPNIEGMKIVEAGETLKRVGLRLRVVGVVTSRDAPADTVVDQTPGASERVREGSLVTVRKSQGPETLSVPRVLGMDLAGARQLLERSDLRVDQEVVRVNKEGAQEGEVIAQSPDAYTSVKKGTRVKLTVHSATAERRFAGEDANTAARYTLRMVLRDLQEPVDVRIDMLDAKGSREVFSERKNPNDIVEVTAIGYGREVVFQVYYNGTKVFEQKQTAPAEILPTPEEAQP